MPLFIGGPLDGRLIEVDPRKEHIEVAVEHPIISDEPIAKKPNKITDIFYYKREILQCPTLEISVFVPRSYNCADLMTALIQGYHQNALSSNQ